jgi:MFS family permease
VRQTYRGVSGDRVTLAVLFGVFGALQGSWAARIPWVADALHLSPGALGLALLGPAVGGVLAMPLAPVLLGRHGTRRVAAGSVVGLGLLLGVLAPAPALPALLAVLTLFGLAGGVLDVAANAHGVAVEDARGRPVMSGLHGAWSVGTLGGAAVGGTAAHLGVGAPVHLAVVGAAGALAGLAVTRRLHAAPVHPGGPAFALPSRATLLLGLIGFGALFAEAAVADWSTVFLARSRGADPGVAAAGYAAFSLCMAAGRFAGDAVVHRFGTRPVMAAGAALTSAGIGLAVTLPGAAGGIVGFALTGIGAACVVPLVFSSAGAAEPDPARRPHALAAVATTSYLGWLAAPPAVGAVAELTSVGGGLALAAGVAATVAVLAAVSPATARFGSAARPGVPH